MTKPILAILAGATAAGSIALAQAAVHGAAFPFGLVNAGSVRDLVLHALGTEPVPQGKIRVPILADGAAYEVIVTKPGLPAQVPLVARSANPK